MGQTAGRGRGWHCSRHGALGGSDATACKLEERHYLRLREWHHRVLIRPRPAPRTGCACPTIPAVSGACGRSW
eukprot:7376076-Prymnesium_polylepis.1